jgi:hypothetical protein
MKSSVCAGICLLTSLQALSAAPIGYWNFDNNADDQSGGTNHGTLLGSAVFDSATARPSALSGSTHSVRFDGANGSLVSINHGVGGMKVNDLPVFSISMWVRGAAAQSDKRVFSEGSTTSNNPLYNIGTSNVGGEALSFYHRFDTGTVSAGNNHPLSTAKVFDNSWHHIVWIDAAGMVSLYVDGIFDRTFTYTDQSLTTDTTTFGGILRAAASHSISGNIDDAAIWNVALTQNDISALVGGISPLNVPVPTTDADGDGLLDVWETLHMLDPDDNGLNPNNHGVAGNPDNGAAGDPDMDNLDNAGEFARGTDPRKADSDDDNVNDGQEIADATNPLDPDTDKDGLNDGEEKSRMTNPLLVDTDGDGVNDGTEVANASDPLDAASPGLAALLCAYWPLDTTDGTTTPDEGANGYDLTLANMDATNFVFDEGRTAASFNNATMTLLSRISQAGEELPINQHAAFTVSMWTKITGTGQSDFRLFSEGSTTNNNPLFNLGTRNNGADNVLDIYLRGLNGLTPNHQYSTGMPLDGTWRHIAVTIEQQGGKVQLFIDGVLDRDNFPYQNAYDPALDTTSIGGILRATASNWVTGLVDDVSLWKAVLPAETIAALAAGDSPLDLTGGKAFIITGIARNSVANEVTLTWNSKPGKFYTVRFSTDLVGDPRTWPDISDSWPSGGEETTYVDTIDAEVTPVRYYVIEQN